MSGRDIRKIPLPGRRETNNANSHPLVAAVQMLYNYSLPSAILSRFSVTDVEQRTKISVVSDTNCYPAPRVQKDHSSHGDSVATCFAVLSV
jgi:hypothetical protein